MNLNMDNDLRLKCLLKSLELAEKGSTDILDKVLEILVPVENRQTQPVQAEIPLTPTDTVEVFINVVERIAKKAGVSTAAILSTTVKLPKVARARRAAVRQIKADFPEPNHRDIATMFYCSTWIIGQILKGRSADNPLQ